MFPKEIYDKFKYSKDVPWYMLNVFEQNCRIRFTSYLYELDSFLIRQFIEYVYLLDEGMYYLKNIKLLFEWIIDLNLLVILIEN